MRHLSPLLLLGLLPACSSDPVQHDSPEVAELPSIEIVVEREIEAEFLHGYWAPEPDFQLLDPKVKRMVEAQMSEDEALTLAYQARLGFSDDQACKLGISQNGEFQGAEMSWSVTQVSGTELELLIAKADESTLAPIRCTREGDILILANDMVVEGRWVRVPEGSEMLIDTMSSAAVSQHLEARKMMAEAERAIESAQEEREKAYLTLASAVRTICESEDERGDDSRDHPLQGESIVAMKKHLRDQEAALMELGIPAAPTSPVRAEHDADAWQVKEDWLSGTWVIAFDLIDWADVLGEDYDPAFAEEVQAILATREREFDIRGNFSDRFGTGNEMETTTGHYCLIPGAGNWSYLTMLSAANEEGIGNRAEEELNTAVIYRVGAVIWFEEAPGTFIPIRHKP